MARTVRVGIPLFISDARLEGFPDGVDLVRMSHEEAGEINVEVALAPWSHAQARQVLPRMRNLKVLQSFGAGIEWLLPLLPEGATLCNAQGLHDAPTAEWAVGAILASLKYMPWYNDLQREGRWVTAEDADTNYAGIHASNAPHASSERVETPVLVEELYGKTVLIVGYGTIGKAIEARLLPFEPAKILRLARSAREGVSPVSDLHTLLPRADIVVLITPLTAETHHLIDSAAIARMKQGALLVNAARGGVVATDALVAALKARRIRAALDVTDPEPLPAGHPLWKAPGLLLTPHVAGSSEAYLERVVTFLKAQVHRYTHGESLKNVISGAY